MFVRENSIHVEREKKRDNQRVKKKKERRKSRGEGVKGQ